MEPGLKYTAWKNLSSLELGITEPGTLRPSQPLWVNLHPNRFTKPSEPGRNYAWVNPHTESTPESLNQLVVLCRISTVDPPSNDKGVNPCQKNAQHIRSNPQGNTSGSLTHHRQLHSTPVRIGKKQLELRPMDTNTSTTEDGSNHKKNSQEQKLTQLMSVPIWWWHVRSGSPRWIEAPVRRHMKYQRSRDRSKPTSNRSEQRTGLLS